MDDVDDDVDDDCDDDYDDDNDDYDVDVYYYDDDDDDDDHDDDALVQLILEDKCISTDSVFSYLKDMTFRHGDGSCRDSAIRNLANYFGNNGTNSHCSCTGNNVFHKYEHDNNIGDDNSWCLDYPSYKAVYDMFFINNQTQNTSDCMSHHSVWYLLNQIKREEKVGFCQRDIVYHISNAIKRYGDPCNCTVQCTDFSSYNELMALANEESCMSVNSVWHILDDLEVKSRQCRKKAQQFLEDKFKHNKASDCVCYPSVPLHDENIQTVSNGSLRTCERSSSYRVIEGLFFSQIKQYGCQDHRHLWSALGNIHTVNGVDCQKDLIIRTTLRFPSSANDTCKCYYPHTSTTSQTSPTTTTSAATITSPTHAPSTNAPLHVTATSTDAISQTTEISTMVTSKYTCNQIATLQSIATATHITYDNSTVCDTDDGGSDDGFTKLVCGSMNRTWYKGISVMEACKANPVKIQPYTAIATFTTDIYNSRGGQSGVFLKCETDGFSMAVQYCNTSPSVIQIDTSGVFTKNPYYYFVVA
ncbi:hypothetical protein ACF0H5_023515 [Mactra antiquata]